MSEAITKTAKYLSRYLNLKIVRKSAVTREVGGQAITTPGEKVIFSQGMFQTDDKEVQDFLEGREEFKKGIIIRVPDGVQDLLAKRADWVKDLETRELEKELARRKAGENKAKDDIKGSTDGAGEGDNVKKDEDLAGKKIKELIEIAGNEGISADQTEPFTKPGAKKADLVEIIVANRKANNSKDEEPKY